MAQFGTLLVANDGRPFRREDFEALSNLGQSSKDPREAIGNKGIGFRSVLEVSRAPEVYSCRPGRPGSFDGYCFRFDPAVLNAFERVVERILRGDDRPVWELEGTNHPVPGVRTAEIRRRAAAGLDVRSEVRFLSPYSLPLPARPPDPGVRALAGRGFATVIRLPLHDSAAREKVEAALLDLSEETILFLPQVGSLMIRSPQWHRTFRRGPERLLRGDGRAAYPVRREVVIESDTSGTPQRAFWLWRKVFGAYPADAAVDHPGRVEAAQLADAVAALPGSWKSLREAELAVAIERRSDPKPGSYFIHLPTQQLTGVAAHLHAPFFGDMSRKAIDQDEPLNRLLLEALADLARDVVRQDLINKGGDEGAAALDITAARGDVGTSAWRVALRKRGITRLPIYFTDKGWKDGSTARVLGQRTGTTILSRATLRSHAAFSALSEALATRESTAAAQIQEDFGCAPDPLPAERADTLESVAIALRASGASDWNAFLSEVMEWVGAAEHVEQATILPDEGGALRAARSSRTGPQFFFPPARGESTSEVIEIPPSLSDRVAFLSSAVTIRQAGQQIRPNALGAWLQKIVEEYRAESILTRVLVPALPSEPTGLNVEAARSCREILEWAVRLVRRADREATLLPALRRMRVPCRGGWYLMQEALAGAGWTDLGGLLVDVLEQVNTPGTRDVLARTLLPPSHEDWGDAAPFIKERRAQLQIGDGLAPVPVAANWTCEFRMSEGMTVVLPPNPPPGVSAEQWTLFTAHASKTFQGIYSGIHFYELQDVKVLPGLDAVGALSAATQQRYAELVVRSIPYWSDGWREMRIHKLRGTHHPPVRSLLAHLLREWDWIWVDDPDSDDGGKRCRPRDLWYVPHLRTHNRYQYAHLDPVPPALCLAIDEAKAGPALQTIGLKQCRIDEQTEVMRDPQPELLQTLGDALASGRVAPGTKAIFVGQVRKAWKWFQVGAASPFPTRLVVLEGGQPKAIPSSAEVFLPGGGTSIASLGGEGGLPVLCIEPKDADELGPQLTARFPKTILPLRMLRWEVQTEGRAWHPSPSAPRLEETELGWLVKVVLAVHAFGPSGTGTSAKTFRRAAAALRSVRVEAATGLAVRLSRGGHTGALEPRTAHLDPGAPNAPATLLYDPSWPKGLAELARPLQLLVERNDLRPNLIQILSQFEPEDGIPHRETLLTALDALEVDDARLQEVELALAGELHAAIRRLCPVAQLLGGTTASTRVARVQNREELERAVDGLHPLLPMATLVEAARDATTDREMGLVVHRLIGRDAELNLWNAALRALGEEHHPIDNGKTLREALDDLRRDLSVPLRALARASVTSGAEYEVIRDALEQVTIPEALADSRWVLTVQDATPVFLGCFENRLSQELQASLLDATSVSHFLAVLHQARPEIELTVDPATVHAENERKCLAALRTIVRTAVVWCSKEKVDIGRWSGLEALEQPLKEGVRTGKGFLVKFDDRAVLENIRAVLPHRTVSPDHAPYASLWAAIENATSVVDLLERLGLTATDLDAGDNLLREREEAARKRRRTELIAGASFDTAAENLGALLGHIEAQCPQPTTLDLLGHANLIAVQKRRRDLTRGKGQTSSTGKGRRYQSQEVKNVIGLAGEIHAYRWLRSTYGDAIGPHCWLSSASRHVFPSNPEQDGAGCDFRLKLPDSEVLVHLEVKATPYDDESFELGSSEIELARDVLKRNRKKKEVFKILHVLDVFSATPTRVLLPNPFDPAHDQFDIGDAGVRVRYCRAAGGNASEHS